MLFVDLSNSLATRPMFFLSFHIICCASNLIKGGLFFMLTATSAAYRRDLGNGLVLRWSTAEDTEKIAQLVSHVFRSSAEEPANTRMADTVRRQMRGDHPLMGPGDYGIIEDTSKEGHPIVACTCLWRQDWEYEGIRFQIGRPEFVGSDPNYRRRGLI